MLNFHGLTSTAAQQTAFSLMSPKADAAKFLVAYPNGVSNSWNAGACCGTAVTENVDDVGFVRALIDDIAARVCLDTKRVYSTGMSNGGYLSNRLACDAADVIAAVAPVSSVIGVPMDTCIPARPIPVISFNGTADTLVDYASGAPQTFAHWANRDGCKGDPKVSFQKGTATCKTYDDCDAGTSVTLCTLEGMGHCWPGQSFCPFGAGTTDLSANDAMWDLFSKTTLP